MIYVILGTRAQLVKMAPVIKEIEQRNWPVTLIHTGQHKEGLDDLLQDFDLRTEWHWIYIKNQEVKTIFHAIKWLLFLMTSIIVKPQLLVKRQSYHNDVILVHGDTFSTVVGALIGKRMNIKVAHIESGLRSFNFLNPFPEEINRIVTFYLSDMAFCPGKWALNNLSNHKKLVKIDTENNTLLDSLKVALKVSSNEKKYSIPSIDYGVVSLHRFENIFFTGRFKKIINQLLEAAKRYHLVFVLHPSTQKRLNKTGLIKNLSEHPNIELRTRTGYFNFIHLLANSRFVLTDGGSNQEELAYLNIPTFLMRKTTERQEGLNSNVEVGNLSGEKLKNFIDQIGSQVKQQALLPMNSPSKKICDAIIFASETKEINSSHQRTLTPT